MSPVLNRDMIMHNSTMMIRIIFILVRKVGMSLLIYSGLLYLVGIAIVLAWKPALMFSKDGNWKEFGIGRSYERYTWLPFWLFAIIWAIISYTIVLVIASNRPEYNVRNNNNNKRNNNDVFNDDMEIDSAKSMKKGYYILNTNSNGPKYVYLGPHAPNLHYEDDD